MHPSWSAPFPTSSGINVKPSLWRYRGDVNRVPTSRKGPSILRSLRPHHTLVLLGDCRQALVEELLDALAAVCFGGEDVAFGIGGDAMHGIKLARLPAAIAEAGQDLHGFASDDIHLLIGAIGEVDILLLRILGERNIPH